MSGPRYRHSIDGQSVDEEDFNLIGEVAAKSEDWVIAEMVRLAPFTNTSAVARAVLPYYTSGLTGAPQLVQAGTGVVNIFPFRAVVGPRIAANASLPSPDPALETAAQLAWKDVRSAVFASNNGTSLGAVGTSVGVTLASNASGNPRWDLVYAALTVDANSNTANIFVKAPGANVGAPTSISRSITQTLTLGVVQGTPAGAPTYPAAPADSATTFYIPLAYVLISNGFSTGVTAIANGKIFPVAPIVSLVNSGFAVAGACGADKSLLDTNNFATYANWGAGATRPAFFMSPMMGVGGKSLLVSLDAVGAAATWNIPDAGVLDQSIDWRRRVFLSTLVFDASASVVFAFNGATNAIPGQNMVLANTLVQPGQSFLSDDNAVLGITTRNGAVVVRVNNTLSANWTAATVAAVYVDMTTGALKVYGTGTPARRAFIWIQASGQMDNP